MKKHELILLAETDQRAKFLLETDPRPWYIPRETKEFLKRSAKYTCAICTGRYQRSKDDLHIDHILPVSRGGTCLLSNLQVLCSWCNMSKSNHYLDPRSYSVGYPLTINVPTDKVLAERVLEKVDCETC